MEKPKIKNKTTKKIVSLVVLIQLVIGLVTPGILYPQPAQAGMWSAIGGGISAGYNKVATAVKDFWTGLTKGDKKDDGKDKEEKSKIETTYPDAMNRVPTQDTKILEALKARDETAIKVGKTENARDTSQQKKEAAERMTWRKFGSITAIAIKAGLRYFLNTLAYETATWLASGDEGQQPQFFTEGWATYLENLADESLGTFIEELGKGWGKFSLCEPPSELKVQVTLGMAAARRPKKPKCTFRQAINNWENFVKEGDFLDRFKVSFDPTKNDITASIAIFDYEAAWSAKKAAAQVAERQESPGGAKSIKEAIADFIKTPAAYTYALVSYVPGLGKDGQTNFTGDLIADAINVFIGTLAGKLFQKMIREGLASVRGSSSSSSSGTSSLRPGASEHDQLNEELAGEIDLLTGSSGQGLFGGRQAAQERFLDFFDADIIEQGDYQILNRLATCTNESSPGSDECVIDHKFRLAVSQGLTVKEALDKGYLDGAAPFGFTVQGFEPSYIEGYPYRSLVILRTHRIIPVTWEIAAQIISRFGKRTYGLSDLIAAYEDRTSPFYHLIDDSWVLKAPDAYCRAGGFGPIIISEQIVDGFRLINRDTYCADYQSCIEKDVSGNCIYGYCMEEKRRWDLQGTQCPDYYATCQSFINRNNQVASYLQNSLEYNSCNIDNVGCNWYCQSYNVIDNIWTCINQDERVLKPCSQVGGCPLTANCEVELNDRFCTDEINKVDLVISTDCGRASKWWDEETGKCLVSAECTVKQNGVLCTQDTCNQLTNLILNPGFESRPNDPGELSDNWLTQATEYFQLASGQSEQVHGGVNSVRFYIPGGLLSEPQVVKSNVISLRPGDYTFSEFIYNRLNVGQATIELSGNVEAPAGVGLQYACSNNTNKDCNPNLFNPITDCENDAAATCRQVVRKTSVLRDEWEQLSTDFKVVPSGYGCSTVNTIPCDPAAPETWGSVCLEETATCNPLNGQVWIAIKVAGSQVSGTAWFDDFKISESCIVDRITLILTGTDEEDQSKIHFDRDALSCSANEAGCSLLLSAPAGVSYSLPDGRNSYNLYAHSSFETDPSQWGLSSYNTRVEREIGDSYYGVSSLRLTRDAISDPGELWTLTSFSTNKPLKRRAFIYSYWAKTSDDSPGLIGSDSTRYNNQIRNLATPYSICSNDADIDCYNNDPCLPDGYCQSKHASHWVSFDMNQSLTDGFGLDTSWKRFAVPIVFEPYCQGGDRAGDFCNADSDCGTGNKCIVPQKLDSGNQPVADDNIEIALVPLDDASKYILYDGVQVQEIDLNRANLTVIPDVGRDQCLYSRDRYPYAIWVNSTCYNLNVASIISGSPVYLKKAPSYLSCQGYTVERPSPYVLDGIRQDICVGETLTWKPDSCQGEFCCHEIDPQECFGYAMYCQADELGCQSYRPLRGGPAIPGVVAYDDYCPLECVGYDAFKQSPTYFESVESLEFFIPNTANQCSAASAGCDEFTNLDEVAQGGEGRHYALYLRQCVKPTADESNCSNFYTWQGSNETGYQLRVYNLDTNQNKPGFVNGSPRLAIEEDERWLMAWGSRSDCDGPEDLTINPFCKEFFGLDGKVHYEILYNTISCSDDCHPYRKTRLGESNTDAQANCLASNGKWNNDVCIYDAIPGEAIACAAAAAGCREYRGNGGGNVFVSFADNFEDGETTDWQFGTISSEALSVGGHSLISSGPSPQRIETMRANLGEICSPEATRPCDANITNNCYQPLANKCIATHPITGQICLVNVGQQYCGVIASAMAPGATYLVSFWAKTATSSAEISVALVDDQGSSYPVIGRTRLSSEWNYYTFGPVTYSDIKPSARFSISATDPASRIFYVDNIQLKQVRDYVYVIKNSWQTPQSCDTNPYVTPSASAPQFMLGCQQYRDLNNSVHNLKSFNRLCREQVVGCNSFVDTHNSTSPYSEQYLPDDAIGNVVVPADQVIYIVNRPQFSCSATAKGCQRLGLPVINQDNNVVSYIDSYVINNPDQYQTSLCGSPEVGCEEYQTALGFRYFKDPRARVCQFDNVGDGGWYRLGSTASEPDCPVERSPLGIIHPTDGWAGVCPAEFSSCTEFVDPISTEAKNIIFNHDFNQDVDNNFIPDGWNVNNSSAGVNHLEQQLSLRRNTPYVLSFDNIDNDNPPMINSAEIDLKIGIIDCPGVSSFDNSMIPDPQGVCINEDGSVSSASYGCLNDDDCDYDGDPITVQRCSFDNLFIPQDVYLGDWDSNRRPDLPDSRTYSGRLFIGDALNIKSCKLFVSEVSEGSGGIGRIKEWLVADVGIRENGLYYQLADSVDRRSCNGVVNDELGCVLFNDRSAANYKIDEADSSYLKFDADMSGPRVNNSVPVANCSGVCDSNVILKVRPDRQCGQWLDCRTKIKTFDEQDRQSDFCLELAACDSLDERGNCDNTVFPDRQLVNNFVLPDGQHLYNLTARLQDADKLANLSGYAKAGITLSSLLQKDSTISGLYPYNLMEQFGGVAVVPNGSFEDWSGNGYPIGWESENANDQWDITKFRVIFNHQDALITQGVSIQGVGSLRLNSNNVVQSDFIDVLKNTNYVFSLDINTINIQPDDSSAVAEIFGFDRDSGRYEKIQESVVRMASRLSWQSRSVAFNTGLFSQLRIKLYNQSAGDEPEGSSYFDNVKLLPALKVANSYLPLDDVWQSDYIGQSCRLFPQEGALSCEYIDSENIVQRGWLGYCIERDPRNPAVCLQWWPIDLTTGDNFSQYKSFPHRQPLYYCAQMGPVPSRVLAGVTGVREPTVDLEGNPPFVTGQDLWVFSGNRNFAQPNFIDVVPVIEAGGIEYDLSPLRLSAENNWEIGYIARGADDDNLNYNDYETYGPTGDPYVCDLGELLSKPLPIDGAQVACDDVVGVGDGGKLPERLIEQHYVAGLGPSGEVMGSARRAFNAVRDPLYCSHGYNSGLDNSDKAIIYVKANFDENGTFKNLEYGLCSDYENCTGSGVNRTCKSADKINWQVYFHYAYCQELVQVVTPTGENKAWLSRLTPGTNYQVDPNGLGYTYTRDHLPYGSVVAPFPQERPTEWDSKDDDQDNPSITNDDVFYLGQQPVFVEAPDTDFDWPYQARAGTPYSCGSGGQSGCYLSDLTRISGGLTDAANRLKRLFAKSYNVWFWSDIEEVGGIRRVCRAGTPKVGEECRANVDCYPGAVQCPLGQNCLNLCIYSGTYNPKITAPGCSTDNNCHRCVDTLVECVDTLVEDPPIDSCAGATVAESCTNAADPDHCVLGNSDSCAGATVAESCANAADTDHCILDTSGSCRNMCTEATNPNDIGNPNDLILSCGLPAGLGQIESDACIVDSPQYQKVDLPNLDSTQEDYRTLFWDPPKRLCAEYNNEDLNRRIGDTFCAVAPIITNITVNGINNDNTYISGTDSVTLSFNPIVNSNQLPIASYKVDWIDDSITDIKGTPLRDRANPDNPYIFSHSYNYYGILEKNQTGQEDYIYCNTGTDQEPLPADIADLPFNSCAIKPRIQVVDNWGWCNGKINPTTREKELDSRWGYRTNTSQDQICYYGNIADPDDTCTPNACADLTNGDCTNKNICTWNTVPDPDRCDWNKDEDCSNPDHLQGNVACAPEPNCFNNPNAWTYFPWYIIISSPQ